MEAEAKRKERLKIRIKAGKQGSGQEGSSAVNGACGCVTLVTSEQELESLKKMTDRFELGLLETTLEGGRVVVASEGAGDVELPVDQTVA